MSYGEILGDKSTMHIRVTLYSRVLDCIVTFIWCVSCTVAVLTCFVICGCVYVWVCVCVGFFLMCGCVGFVMCGCVYVWVL